MIRLNYDDGINCGKIKFTNADDDDDDDDTVVIQLQLQWYAWVKFLQLLPQCRKTTFLGRIQSYSFSHITNTHQYSLASSLSLMSPSYAKEQATLHHIISYTITCHVLLRFFFLWFFNFSLKNFPHRLHGTYSGTQLTCVPPLPPSSLTPAFLSHPIGCDAISSNGERMRRCWGRETKRPRDHPTHSGHKNLHSQDLSLVFPLPQGEKHIYNIYSDIFWLFDFIIVNEHF